MSGVRRPPAPLLDGLRWLFAILAAIATWLAVASARPEASELAALLDGAHPITRATAGVEEAWIEEAFEPYYLPSPPGPLACIDALRTVPRSIRGEVKSRLRAHGRDSRNAATELEELTSRHSGSWLPPLMAANLYLRAGDEASAERVLDRYLGSSAGRRLIERTSTAVQGGSVPPLEQVLAAIHLLQSSAYVQIERSTITEGRLRRDLRNPIGYVRLLGWRQMLPAGSSIAAEAPWQGVRIPSPGCRAAKGSLTSRDLYNNLIVGYLRVPGFRETQEMRDREFSRDYEATAATHPAFSILRKVVREWQPEREGWVWAVSNAERILRDLPWGGGPENLEVKPWVALNLAQLLESTRSEAPAEARDALSMQVSVLTKAAEEGRVQMEGAQEAEFHPALARMSLLDVVRSGNPEPLPDVVLDDLDQEQSTTARAVMTAVEARDEPEDWLALATGEKEADLGSGDAAWRRAAREDLAATLALRGVGAEEEERREWAWRARSVLRLGDEAPPELVEIEEGLGFAWKLPLQARSVFTHPIAGLLAALVAAALAFLVGRYLGEELRRRRALFTSFYRLEAEEMQR